MADKMQFDDYSNMSDPSKVEQAAQQGYNATKMGTEAAKEAYDAMKAQKAAKAAQSAGKTGKAVGQIGTAKKAGAAGKAGGSMLSGSLSSMSTAGVIQSALIIVLVMAMLCVFVNLSPSLFSASETGVTKAVGNVRSAISSYYNDAINQGVKKNDGLYTYLNDKVTGSADKNLAISDAKHVATSDIEGNGRDFSCDVSASDYHFLAGNTTAYLDSDYCRINFDFTPSLAEQTEIIYAYGQAINGALSAYTKSAREEGKGASDMNDELGANGETANDDFDWSQLKNEEYVANYTADNGNEYNSATSKAFSNAIADYAKEHTMFFMDLDPSHWILEGDPQVETKTIEKKACKLAALANGTSNASQGAVSTLNGASFDCGGVAPEGYSIVDDPANTKEIDYLFVTLNYTAPVYFDMSAYKIDEIDNVLTAMQDEMGMDPDKASEAFYNQVSDYYRNYISMFGLEEVEAKVLQAQYQGASIPGGTYDPTLSDQMTGLAYMGIAAETLNGADNWIGSVIDSSNFNYADYKYTDTDNIYNDELVHRYAVPVWAHVLALANEGKIQLSYPPDVSQCTNFAQAWVYDHWGISLPGANGNAMAKKLIDTFPSMFEYGNAPAPGGLISILPNHIMCCDAVIDSDGDGNADYYVISDGNVMTDGVRIQMTVSVAKYMYTWGGAHPVYANPINH